MVRRDVIRQERERKCHGAAAIGREIVGLDQTNSKQKERIQNVSNKLCQITRDFADTL